MYLIIYFNFLKSKYINLIYSTSSNTNSIPNCNFYNIILKIVLKYKYSKVIQSSHLYIKPGLLQMDESTIVLQNSYNHDCAIRAIKCS